MPELLDIAEFQAKAEDADVVHITGTETVTGDKAFSGQVDLQGETFVQQAPTDPNHAVNKDYVDSMAGGIGGSTGSTDNALLRADGTGGSTLQSSLATINDTGVMTTPQIVMSGGGVQNLIDLYQASPGNYFIGIGSGSIYFRSGDAYDFSFLDGGGIIGVKFDMNATATHTPLLVWDNDNAALGRVSVGAANSGGAGFKLLRIPN